MPLSAKASPFHSAVTLYEAVPGPSETEDQKPEHTPRRSKRVRTRLIEDKEIVDIEDAQSSVRVEAKKRKVIKQEDSVSKNSPSGPSPKKKKKPLKMSLDVPHPTPKNWLEVYNAIREMRQKKIAPVDTMGCDTAQLHEVDPKVVEF